VLHEPYRQQKQEGNPHVTTRTTNH
jgi:hypothetical protein